MTTSPTSTRHLVDAELAPALEVFPPFAFTSESLPLIRQAMDQAAASAPDAADLYPDIERREVLVPSPEGAPDVRILLYRSRSSADGFPAVLYIHGGGFVIGRADNDDLTCCRLASETGAVVASVDYRLAPETRAPGPLDDCYTALSWVHDEAASLGVDTQRLAVVGMSAGGGLAACLAILARDRGDITVTFQALVYPMLDDRTATTRATHPYAGEFIWTPADNRFGWEAFLGTEPGGADTSQYAAAARVEDARGLPATFICVGSLDLFAVEDLAFATRLVEAGVPTELHLYPGGYHGFQMTPDAQMAKAYARALSVSLNRHFHDVPSLDVLDDQRGEVS